MLYLFEEKTWLMVAWQLNGSITLRESKVAVPLYAKEPPRIQAALRYNCATCGTVEQEQESREHGGPPRGGAKKLLKPLSIDYKKKMLISPSSLPRA